MNRYPVTRKDYGIARDHLAPAGVGVSDLNRFNTLLPNNVA
jgi:hypothetical protein